MNMGYSGTIHALRWDEGRSLNCMGDMMRVVPTIVLLLHLVLGLSLVACAPPTPKVAPPDVSQT